MAHGYPSPAELMSEGAAARGVWYESTPILTLPFMVSLAVTVPLVRGEAQTVVSSVLQSLGVGSAVGQPSASRQHRQRALVGTCSILQRHPLVRRRGQELSCWHSSCEHASEEPRSQGNTAKYLKFRCCKCWCRRRVAQAHFSGTSSSSHGRRPLTVVGQTYLSKTRFTSCLPVPHTKESHTMRRPEMLGDLRSAGR